MLAQNNTNITDEAKMGKGDKANWNSKTTQSYKYKYFEKEIQMSVQIRFHTYVVNSFCLGRKIQSAIVLENLYYMFYCCNQMPGGQYCKALRPLRITSPARKAVVSTEYKLLHIVMVYAVTYFSKAVSYANKTFIALALGLITLFWQTILPQSNTRAKGQR